MELEDLKAMLDDQRLLVRALHDVRMEIAQKKGYQSQMYQQVTQWYEEEMRRYRDMDRQYSYAKAQADYDLLKDILSERLRGYVSSFGRIIDLVPERQSRGGASAQRNYKEELDYQPNKRMELIKKEIEALIRGREIRALPRPKKQWEEF
jgi:hypothetical protein